MANVKDVKAWTLTLAILFAVLHTAKVLLVLAGGLGFLNWVQAIHLVTVGAGALPFDATNFVVGIVVAFVVGGIVGFLFANIYNRVAARKK
jgi:hypothetical protein